MVPQRLCVYVKVGVLWRGFPNFPNPPVARKAGAFFLNLFAKGGKLDKPYTKAAVKGRKTLLFIDESLRKFVLSGLPSAPKGENKCENDGVFALGSPFHHHQRVCELTICKKQCKLNGLIKKKSTSHINRQVCVCVFDGFYCDSASRMNVSIVSFVFFRNAYNGLLQHYCVLGPRLLYSG